MLTCVSIPDKIRATQEPYQVFAVELRAFAGNLTLNELYHEQNTLLHFKIKVF